MSRLLLFFLCLFSFCFANTQESSIDFIIKNLGVNVDGHFNTFNIVAGFDNTGQLTGVTSAITVSSIETGIDSRDEHILEDDYFDAKNHPRIVLKSTSVKVLNPNSYEVTANLSIKGKTKTIKIPITVKREENVYLITSFFEINRKDYDVGGGGFIMGKTVKINVKHYQSI
jgi:polyisoprenoid-binding protein YceI